MAQNAQNFVFEWFKVKSCWKMVNHAKKILKYMEFVFQIKCFSDETFYCDWFWALFGGAAEHNGFQ